MFLPQDYTFGDPKPNLRVPSGQSSLSSPDVLQLRNSTRIEKYDLSPTILGTCRQVNEEAISALYGRNKFIVGFTENRAVRSPISRGEWCGVEGHRRLDLEMSPGFKKVRHWKAIATADPDDCTMAPNPNFVRFCRSLSENAPQSLEVWIMPNLGLLRVDWGVHNITEVLQPLNLLRNVGRFELAQLSYNDLPGQRWTPPPSSVSPHKFPPGLEESLRSLVESDTPVNRVWKIYEKLLTYAQAFERNDQFRTDMKPLWGDGKRYAVMRPEDIVGFKSNRAGNSFTGYLMHPVEAALRHASFGSETNDLEKVLSARTSILHYLELQYQRIVNASLQIVEFIKDHKKQYRYFDPHGTSFSYEWSTVATQALILLEDYSTSFIRDIPASTRMIIRKNQRTFDLSYASMGRESLLKRLSSTLESDNLLFSPAKSIEWFQQAVDDMDEQYLQIRQARKQLFDCDDEEYERVIDSEKCGDAMKWLTAGMQQLASGLSSQFDEDEDEDVDALDLGTQITVSAASDDEDETVEDTPEEDGHSAEMTGEESDSEEEGEIYGQAFNDPFDEY